MATGSGKPGEDENTLGINLLPVEPAGTEVALLDAALGPVFPQELPELNQDILENLFSLCSFKEIARFRLVSKTWAEASVKFLRNSGVCRVVERRKRGRSPNYLLLSDLISRSEDPNDSLKLTLTKAYKYKMYKLEGWYLRSSNPNMVKFWNYFSLTINHLELSSLTVDSVSTLEEILYGNIPNCRTLILDRIFVKTVLTHEITLKNYSPPKLKTLKVRNLNHFPVNWLTFFEHFQDLEELESVDYRTDFELARMISAIASIRVANQDVLMIRKLTIIRAKDSSITAHLVFSLGMREALSNCNFEIEDFTLKLGFRTFKHAARASLALWADTLKVLRFDIDFGVEGRALETREFRKRAIFPYGLHFPNLEQLVVVQWCKPYPFVLNILKAAPKLKSLKFEGLRHSKIWFNMRLLPLDQHVAGFRHPELTEFSFNLTKFLPENFKTLPVFAPNLTKLDCRLDDEMFRFVCQNLPNLEEIRISSKKITDDGITGLVDDNCPGPSSRVVQWLPNITRLKCLRVFVVRDKEHLLTSKSVFLGFLHVPNLFTLEMSLPPDQISGYARQVLEKAIPNLIVV